MKEWLEWMAVLESAIAGGQKSYLPSQIRIAGNSSRQLN